MAPGQRAAGLAGILAGVGLAIEFGLFMASGWTPDVFADPVSALRFLQEGGEVLRSAAFVGFLNLAFMIVFLAGLAGALHEKMPSRASAFLYLGLVGVAAHALVPLGLWLGTPIFLDLAASDQEVARAGWAGFSAFLDAAGGVGYLFDGFAFAIAGLALIPSAGYSTALGWVGLLGGGMSALTVVGTATPIEGFTAALYMPALLLVIVFRFWGGATLWREARHD